MPIPCVDVLPVQVDQIGKIIKVGMIFRDTPHQGKRWCMVGGRMWRNESFVEAATRQLRETLGADVQFTMKPDAQPHYIAQYFTSTREVGYLDPRQHAVTMVFAVAISGAIKPGGEASGFEWFDLNKIPDGTRSGFRQDEVARECLKRVAVLGL